VKFESYKRHARPLHKVFILTRQNRIETEQNAEIESESTKRTRGKQRWNAHQLFEESTGVVIIASVPVETIKIILTFVL
jgi:hypothetical protein